MTSVHRSDPMLAKCLVHVFAIVPCMVILLASGCGRSSNSTSVIEKDQAEKAVTMIIDKLDGSSGILKKVPAVNRTPLIHFDRFGNMTGFITAEDTNYRKMLEKLATLQTPTQTYRIADWQGDTGQSQLTPFQTFLKQGSYDYAATDYESLLPRLASSKASHVLVTDGVFWKSSNAQYAVPPSEVAKAVEQRLKTGGRVNLTVLSSAYEFAYKSARAYSRFGETEPLKNFVQYNTTSRPFALWEFFAPNDGMSLVQKACDQLGKEVVSPFSLHLGEPLVALTPTEQAPDAGAQAVDTLEPLDLAGLQTVYTAQVIAPKAPFFFACKIKRDLVPIKSRAGPAFKTWLASQLLVEVRCWSIDASLGADQPELVKKEAPVTVEQTEFIPAPENSSPESLAALLKLKLPRPGGSDGPGESVLVWVITVRARYSDAIALAEAISTEDDSTPEAAAKLLNFKTLVENLVTRNNIVGRVIYITEWFRP